MQCSPTSSPTSIRPSSIDSLCVPDDEHFSQTAAQEVSPSPSTAATIDVLHEYSVKESTMPSSACNSTTRLGPTGPAPQVHQSKQSVWSTAFLRDKWLWETTCILFSIACMMTITILSYRLDGAWLSKWTFFLQPSTTFSILVTAAQSSMMFVIAEVLSQLKWLQMSLPKAQSLGDFAIFDSASRGPLGSLRLLYLWEPRSSILPSMVYAASLITVVALAMGPFTQQVISVQADNLVPTDGINSTIAVANYYNRQPSADDLELHVGVDRDGTIKLKVNDTTAIDVDPGIQGAFYDGYYDLGKSSIDFNCPSSNCSWEIFNSLGVCSACRNVTENTQVINNNRTKLDDMNIIKDYTIRTPGGWSIGMCVIDQVAAAAKNSFNVYTLRPFSANLVSMVVVQRLSHVTSPLADFVATECSIGWCAKQYSNVTIINGRLQHLSIHEVPLWPVAGQDFGGLSKAGKLSNQDWVLFLTPNIDGGNVSSPLPPFDNNVFNVSIYDHMALSQYFISKFEVTSYDTTALFGNGQNVTSTLLHMADSVTNSIMRWNPEMAALGIVWHQEPSTKVHWWWLAFPLAVVVFSAILLAMTIAASRYYNAPHWKSSPLPFLFHGIQNWNDDEELDLVEGRLEKVHAMEGRAKSKRVQIVTSLKGGRWLA